jgi:hypothetical protein
VEGVGKVVEGVKEVEVDEVVVVVGEVVEVSHSHSRGK